MANTTINTDTTNTTTTAPAIEASEGEFYSSPMIFSKSSGIGEDNKGRTKVHLLLSDEESKMLAESVNLLVSGGKRVKIQIHLTDDNAFFFIKEVQPKGAAFSKKASTGGASGYKPATGGNDVRSKIAGMKKQA
jgi:hypothetical protein